MSAAWSGKADCKPSFAQVISCQALLPERWAMSSSGTGIGGGYSDAPAEAFMFEADVKAMVVCLVIQLGNLQEVLKDYQNPNGKYNKLIQAVSLAQKLNVDNPFAADMLAKFVLRSDDSSLPLIYLGIVLFLFYRCCNSTPSATKWETQIERVSSLPIRWKSAFCAWKTLVVSSLSSRHRTPGGIRSQLSRTRSCLNPCKPR